MRPQSMAPQDTLQSVRSLVSDGDFDRIFADLAADETGSIPLFEQTGGVSQ
jgi:hypothetical protein